MIYDYKSNFESKESGYFKMRYKTIHLPDNNLTKVRITKNSLWKHTMTIQTSDNLYKFAIINRNKVDEYIDVLRIILQERFELETQ